MIELNQSMSEDAQYREKMRELVRGKRELNATELHLIMSRLTVEEEISEVSRLGDDGFRDAGSWRW